MTGSRSRRLGAAVRRRRRHRGDDNRLLDLSAKRNQFYGLGLFGSAGSVVRNSSGVGAFGHDGDGMILFDSRHVRIVHNAFRHNIHGGIVTLESKRNLIRENLFSQNGDEAFLMEGGKRFRLRGNIVTRNGAGITLGPGSHNVIAGNRVSRGRDGIRIEKGHDNLVANMAAAARAAAREHRVLDRALAPQVGDPDAPGPGGRHRGRSRRRRDSLAAWKGRRRPQRSGTGLSARARPEARPVARVTLAGMTDDRE